MQDLGLIWFAVVLILGVVWTALKLIFGARGVAAAGEAGQGGGGLGNAATTMLGIAVIAFIGRDVIDNGPLTQAVGSILVRIATGT